MFHNQHLTFFPFTSPLFQTNMFETSPHVNSTHHAEVTFLPSGPAVQRCSTAWSPIGLEAQMTASCMTTHMRRGRVTITALLHPHSANSRINNISLRGLRRTAGRAGSLRTTRGRRMSTTSPGSGRKTTSPKPSQVNCNSERVYLNSLSFLSLILKLLSSFLATVQFEGTERERSWAQPEQTRLTKTGATSNSTTLRLTGDTPPLLGERVDPYVPLERQV